MWAQQRTNSYPVRRLFVSRNLSSVKKHKNLSNISSVDVIEKRSSTVQYISFEFFLCSFGRLAVQAGEFKEKFGRKILTAIFAGSR
jgi:hypothetical protein